ncbi:MAG TPA: hypothetical protein VFB66_11650 [Tepidisphaeraceae bacterium]|nr:hypothetical protein [Tepidisphaeraceae bacterium]
MRKQVPGKLLGVLAVLAGVGLAYFEVRDFEVPPDGWFWLFVALFLVILGVVELATKKPVGNGGANGQ